MDNHAVGLGACGFLFLYNLDDLAFLEELPALGLAFFEGWADMTCCGLGINVSSKGLFSIL